MEEPVPSASTEKVIPIKTTLAKYAAVCMAAALAAAACAPGGEPADVPIALGRSQQLVPQVVESLNNAGLTPSVTLGEEGNPTVAYQLMKPLPEPGAIPAPIIPGQPQPPAIVLSTFSDGAWSKTAVTPQTAGKPDEAVAKQIANDKGEALPGVSVALASDAQGGHHVVWSTPSGLFYSTNSGGEFGDPQQVVKAATSGGSIAVAEDGTPWIAYYQGATVSVATSTGDAWRTEAAANVGGTTSLPARTAIQVDGDGQPVVAFADPGAGAPKLARRQGGGWSSEVIQAGGGGLGISLALDNDGNPHVAYYSDAGEAMHAHSVGGTGWETNTVSTGGAEAAAGDDKATWSTGIALDDQGVHYVTWADVASRQVMLANNAEGDFAANAVPGSQSGVSPDIAVSSDGEALALAWYDPVNENLAVATPAIGGLVLANPSPQATKAPIAPVPSVDPDQEPPCEPEGDNVTVSAANLSFNTDCLAAPAGKPFTIAFNNEEAVPHNVAIYSDQSAQNSFFQGEVITGPQTIDYNVDSLDEGVYFFQCDVHPLQMQGQFAAVATEGG